MLSTTHYWSSIHVDKLGRAPVRQASAIKTWLNRSGLHRPLFISIGCPPMEVKRAQKFLEIFASYTCRVKYLRFAGLAAYVNILLEKPFPVLETLDFYHMTKFVKDIHSTDSLAASWGGVSFHDTRASRDIHIPESVKRILFPRLGLNQRPNGFISFMYLHASWKNITRLEWVPANTFSDISLIFRQCSSLKECLCCITWTPHLGDLPSAVIQHDRLESLIIHILDFIGVSHSLLNSLTLPQLTHIEIHRYLGSQFPHSVLHDFFERSRSSEKLASLKFYLDPISSLTDFDEDQFMGLVQALNRLAEFVVVYRREGVEYDLVTQAMKDVIDARLLV